MLLHNPVRNTTYTSEPYRGTKNFAMGKSDSSNYSVNSATVNPDSVEYLAIKYGFALIPWEAPEVQAAYGSEANLDLYTINVWYGPTTDETRFYYVAFTGSPYFPTPYPAFLVCRNISDGSLVYARDCTQYNLNNTPNFLGYAQTMIRVAPAIYGDRLYLGSGYVSTIGPQLFAINKYTGDLIWGLAYDLPDPIDVSRGILNAQLSDLNIVVHRFRGDRYPTIFCGVSSLQNAFNSSDFATGIPAYGDQGKLFQILDKGPMGEVAHVTPLTAPKLHAGDVVSNEGEDAFNPFMPKFTDPCEFMDYTIISTISEDTVIDPYIFVNDPDTGFEIPASLLNTSPMGAVVVITADTVIDATLFQTAFTLVDGSIRQDNLPGSFTIAQLIAQWTIEQANLPAPTPANPNPSVRHTIWFHFTPAQVTQILSQTGNAGLIYLKVIRTGTTIANENDAQGLNYFGNSTWGSPVAIDGDQIYFGTGQSYAIPFFEAFYYAAPSRNFETSRTAFIQAQQEYIDWTITNQQLTHVRNEYLRRMHRLSKHGLRSPRGLMSYASSVMGINREGEILFGARTIPNDVYIFFIPPLQTILNVDFNTSDADVASGIKIFRNGRSTRLAACNKAGIGIVLDITNLKTRKPFDHWNLRDVGVEYPVYQYLGASGLLGGSNYGSTQFGDLFITCQANDPFLRAGGVREVYITPDGRILYRQQSYLSAMNVASGEIEWIAALPNVAIASPTVDKRIVFTADLTGKLFAHDAATGEQLWEFNNTMSEFPTFGGISSPAVLKNLLIWTPDYFVPNVEGVPPNPTVRNLYGIALAVRKTHAHHHC